MVLQGTTYWTDLFVRHFLFQEEQSIDCDDLLFFVRKRHVKGSSRYLPKYEVRGCPTLSVHKHDQSLYYLLIVPIKISFYHFNSIPSDILCFMSSVIANESDIKVSNSFGKG